MTRTSPGISVLQTMLVPLTASQCTGGLAPSPIPEPDGPRNCGQSPASAVPSREQPNASPLHGVTTFLNLKFPPPCFKVKLASESNSTTNWAGANSKTVATLGLGREFWLTGRLQEELAFPDEHLDIEWNLFRLVSAGIGFEHLGVDLHRGSRFMRTGFLQQLRDGRLLAFERHLVGFVQRRLARLTLVEDRLDEFGIAAPRHGSQALVSTAVPFGDQQLRHADMLALEDQGEHGELVEGVPDVGAGALVEQKFDDFFVAVHGREIKRRLAVGCLGFQGRALFEERLDRGKVAFARGVQQFLVDISRDQRQRRR